MSFGQVNMLKPGAAAIVTVCDWCGSVLDGVRVPYREHVTIEGRAHLCVDTCAKYADRFRRLKSEPHTPRAAIVAALRKVDRDVATLERVVVATRKSLSEVLQ